MKAREIAGASVAVIYPLLSCRVHAACRQSKGGLREGGCGGHIKVGVSGFTLQVVGKHGRWVEEEGEISIWVIPEQYDIWAFKFLKISAT